MATILTQGSIDHFLLSLSENGSSEHTIRAYRTDLMGWMDWTPTHQILTVSTPNQLKILAKQYITANRTNWSAKTTLRKISSIRSFGRFVGVDLLVGYRAPRPADPIPHPIPEGISGVLDMLAEADSDDRKLLVVLTGLCGCRVSEARAVRWSHFDWPERTLLVHGKGGKERYVPLSAMAFHTLFTIYLARSEDDSESIEGWQEPIVHLSDRGARNALTRLGKRCSLSRPVASHDMRATFATAAANKTNNLRVVQELLGHASLKTTQVYTGVSLRQKREAVEIV